MKEGGVVWSPSHYRMHDRLRCQASARRVLDWKFETLLDLHTYEDGFLRGGAYDVVDELLGPLTNDDFDALPFGSDTLDIPEGKLTGGDWKSYR
jgi:hypothetical protein